ncbi:penicillin-binding transpeptidase domain-containing protein [Brucella abortus]|nr:penicillin-binding transpeptidase domain-containing protein [Brucella abortus]
MDPHTGRVLAMVGGFPLANRSLIAPRRPIASRVSSLSRLSNAAALDNGYTPASVVLDGPLEIDQGGSLGIWAPKNFSGKFAGPSTLRYGIEQSRNVMTVRLAQDMGMKLVVEYARAFRYLRQDVACSLHGAWRGRNHGASYGDGLFDYSQWRAEHHAIDDRPHSGPLRQDRVQA